MCTNWLLFASIRLEVKKHTGERNARCTREKKSRSLLWANFRSVHTIASREKEPKRKCVGVIVCENREYSSEMCSNELISIDFVIDCIQIITMISKILAIRPMRYNKNNNVSNTSLFEQHFQLFSIFKMKSIVRMTNELIHKIVNKII